MEETVDQTVQEFEDKVKENRKQCKSKMHIVDVKKKKKRMMIKQISVLKQYQII